ncbi:hypothetical protein [Pseudolysinimonas kribbensis]
MRKAVAVTVSTRVVRRRPDDRPALEPRDTAARGVVLDVVIR